MKDYISIIKDAMLKDKKEIVLTCTLKNNDYVYIIYKDADNQLFGGKFNINTDDSVLETKLTAEEKKLLEQIASERGIK